AARQNVGPYLINLGNLAAGPNYNVSLSATPVNFNITKPTPTATLSPYTTLFRSSADPVIAYTHSPLTNGDTDAVFGGALARAAGEHVASGPYLINLGTLSAGSNFMTLLSSTPVTFAITPKPVTVTPNSSQSKIYG